MVAEEDETGRLSCLGWQGEGDKKIRRKGKQGRTPKCGGRGLDLGPHLSRDLVLVIMREVLELSKDIFSGGEGFRPVAPPLLPVLPT